MKKFKYLKLSKTKKLRYSINYYEKKLYLIFLHGFMSDIEGKKPQTLFKFSKKNKLGFLSLEYSGHGKSSGIFTDGNISILTVLVVVIMITLGQVLVKHRFFLPLVVKHSHSQRLQGQILVVVLKLVLLVVLLILLLFLKV